LDQFVERLQTERNNHPQIKDSILDVNARANGLPGYHTIIYEDGNRFVRIFDLPRTHPDDKGGSISYFVEKNTGIIFGAKSLKIYNPNHEYGTLLTIDEWDWSGYYAVHKEGKSSLVPKSLRR